MIKKILDFFIFSSIYIAICAVIMVVQTYQLLIHSRPSFNLMAFVFFSTICSYSFHWYLTPHSVAPSERIIWANRHKHWHFLLYLIGLTGSVYFFSFIRQYWLALAFGAFVTFLYSAPKLPHPVFRKLKDIAIGKTIFLAFVWMYVTTILPMVVADAPWEPDFIWFVLGRFFFIYAICILFDYRDREDDKIDGIKSLITYFGEKGIDRVFALSLVLFALTTIALYSFHSSLFLIGILLLPGAMVAILYPYAKRNFSDYLYYLVLDGLMMFSGLVMLVSRI